MGDLIYRQSAIDSLANMYRAAEKWGQEADDDVIKARAESCMASLVEMKLRIEKLPSAQPDVPDTNDGDMISRQATMKEFADFVRRSNNSDFAPTPTWNDAVSLVGSMPSAQDEKKGEAMSEIVREMTREELVAFNNELRAENEKLKAELQEERLAAEHNCRVAEENQLKHELRYKDGVIYGMKYALRCNGVSGGDVDR